MRAFLVKMSKNVCFFGIKMTDSQYSAENRGPKSQEGKSKKFEKICDRFSRFLVLPQGTQRGASFEFLVLSFEFVLPRIAAPRWGSRTGCAGTSLTDYNHRSVRLCSGQVSQI